MRTTRTSRPTARAMLGVVLLGLVGGAGVASALVRSPAGPLIGGGIAYDCSSKTDTCTCTDTADCIDMATDHVCEWTKGTLKPDIRCPGNDAPCTCPWRGGPR
jgi:hypothetical protein